MFYLKECLGVDLERYLFVSDLEYLKRFSFDRPVTLKKTKKQKQQKTNKPKRRKDYPIKICYIFNLKECLGVDLERYLFVSDLEYLKRFSFDRPVTLKKAKKQKNKKQTNPKEERIIQLKFAISSTSKNV